MVYNVLCDCKFLLNHAETESYLSRKPLSHLLYLPPSSMQSPSLSEKQFLILKYILDNNKIKFHYFIYY